MGKVLGNPIRPESVFLGFSLAYAGMSAVLAINSTPVGDNAMPCYECFNMFKCVLNAMIYEGKQNMRSMCSSALLVSKLGVPRF